MGRTSPDRAYLASCLRYSVQIHSCGWASDTVGGWANAQEAGQADAHLFRGRVRGGDEDVRSEGKVIGSKAR